MKIFNDLKNNIRLIFNRHDITAILDDDLPALIEQLGLTASISSGSIKCASCHDVITLNNIAGMRKESDAIYFYCQKTVCTNLFASPINISKGNP
jgi:hypothetical protein